MNSFDEFENATAHPPEASKLPGQSVPKEKPGNNEVPAPPEMPQVKRPSMASKVDEWIKLAVKWIGVLFLLALLFWWLFQSIPVFVSENPKVIEKTDVIYQVPEGTQSQITQLKKDVNWLRHLLKKAKRQLRVERENHATTRVKLMNALQVKSADEKYHEFLKHALDDFHNRPFKPGEQKRTICFTTDQNNKECLQIERPYGWGEQQQPVKVRRL